MIKRMNKVTSLLVAAAAIVSVVPANAAEKLATQEGTIYNAVAFDGGKYLFDGYKSDEDDSAVYYNDGNKDKLLEDVEDYTTFKKYGKKSVLASKNEADDDQYIIDMSTGKASDDETIEDIRLNLQSKLNSILRKTDRYENAENKKAIVSESDLTLVSGGTFNEVWFEYEATTGNSATVYGYTNESAKYIDASVTANISVFSTSENKVVKIKEFNKPTDGVKATLITEGSKAPQTIAQDSNYIYRIVTVELTGAEDVEGNELKEATFLQKISKAQGDTKDDAYLPKTVESYQITNKSTNDDANDAYNELNKNILEYIVVDGNLYTVRIDTTGSKEKVVVAKYSIKRNEKIKYDNGKDYDTALVKLVDTVDEKVELKEGDTEDAISIDVDGNVWFVSKGKIYRSVKGGDFEVVYTCDGTMNRLDVYNKDNLIVWNQDQEIFATVQGVEEEKEEVIETVKTGWQSENGTWYLYDAAGNKLTGWQLVNGAWYYMDPTTTAMRTGWLNDNGTWYYLQSSGAMKTGWLNDNGTWYYLQSSGAMKTGWLNDNGTWYYLQSSGAMKTGWLNDNGTWYYLNANGSMAANTTVDGYRLGANGAWIR